MSLAGPREYFIECSLGCFDIICVGWKLRFKAFFDYSLHPSAAFTYADQEQDLVEGLELDTVELRSRKRGRMSIYKELAVNDSIKVEARPVWPGEDQTKRE